MSQYTKYKLYKLQRRISGSSDTWIDVVPTTYSYDGNGTQTPVIVESASTDCGYVPPTEPIYKWENIPISQGYECDECLKFELRYSDSTTYGLECSSSTTLTRAEISGGSSPYSAITSADIGGCVTRIDASAFTDCIGLTSIIIPSGVSTIGGNAFYRCSGITSITINDGVTTIGTDAFRLTNISSVIIPNSVTHFDGFMQCYNLTNIIIGTSVSTFGVFALYNCTSLESITINATTPPTLTSYSIYNTNNCPIYVPAQSVQAYKEASVWSDYASRIQAITT